MVLAEEGRDELVRELVGAAAELGHEIGARVVVVANWPIDEQAIGSWGGDEILIFEKLIHEEDLARAVGDWAGRVRPWGVLVPSTAWGREVAGRMAAILGAGLTGDAVELGVEDGRLVAWKSAFGGSVVVAVRARSDTQMVTVRPGALAMLKPRAVARPDVTRLFVEGRGRVRVSRRWRDDDVERLAKAGIVIGVGQGVAKDDHGPLLMPLAKRIGAEIAATRKVTDKGWLPRRASWGLPAAALRRACISPSAPVESSITCRVCAMPAPWLPSTRTRMRRSTTQAMSASSRTGARRCRPLVDEIEGDLQQDRVHVVQSA